MLRVLTSGKPSVQHRGNPDKGISSEGKAEAEDVYISTRRGFQRSHRAEMVGLGRLELPTSPLSGVHSNQLSYRPSFLLYLYQACKLCGHLLP